jgi:hypothetical protein
LTGTGGWPASEDSLGGEVTQPVSGGVQPAASAVAVTGEAVALRLSSDMAEIKRLFAAFAKALDEWK